MSRLILLRHAKSDWNSGVLSDVDRPVSARGQHALSIVAAEVGAFVQPDSFVLCSPAVRTRQTFDLARPHWPDCRFNIIDSLYEGEVRALSQAVKGVGKAAECVIVIGHNPGLVMFLNWCLVEEEITADCVHMPTSCAAVLELASGFAELQKGQAKLTAFIRAKDLIAEQAKAVSC